MAFTQPQQRHIVGWIFRICLVVVLSNPTGDGNLGFAGLVDASSFLRGTHPKGTDSSIAPNDQDPTELGKEEKEEEEYYNQYIRSGRKKTSTRNFKPGTEGGFYDVHDFTADGDMAQDDGSEDSTTAMEERTDRDRELHGKGYKYGGYGRRYGNRGGYYNKGYKAGYGYGRGGYGRRYGGGYNNNNNNNWGYGGGYNNAFDTLNFFTGVGGGDDGFSNPANFGDDNWRFNNNYNNYNSNGFYRNSFWV